MQWREALDEAADAAAVEALNDEVLAYRSESLDALTRTLDERQDWPAAAQQVRALMFVERFAQDLDRRLEALGQ
jgi:molecular chaperone HscB